MYNVTYPHPSLQGSVLGMLVVPKSTTVLLSELIKIKFVQSMQHT